MQHIFILLLPEGRAGGAWGSSNKMILFPPPVLIKVSITTLLLFTFLFVCFVVPWNRFRFEKLLSQLVTNFFLVIRKLECSYHITSTLALNFLTEVNSADVTQPCYTSVIVQHRCWSPQWPLFFSLILQI
jgi:hypothetical protein